MRAPCCWSRSTLSYHEITAKVAEIGDAFRTWSALIGCSMFFSVAMIISHINAAWPDPLAAGIAVWLWVLALAIQCWIFEATRERTARQLQAALRAWWQRGPGAYGASIIEAEPLRITYEHLGRRKRATIAFLWSRIEFDVG
jgi:hypothetical protein